MHFESLAMYTDGFWYRGRIVGISCNNEFEVFYVDYGSTCTVRIDQLRHLHMEFTKLPIQAKLSRLYGIRPYPDVATWSVESSKFLFNTVKGESSFDDFKICTLFMFLLFVFR